MFHAMGIRQHFTGFGLKRQINAVTIHIGIRRIQQRQITRITGPNILAQVILKTNRPPLKRLRLT